MFLETYTLFFHGSLTWCSITLIKVTSNEFGSITGHHQWLEYNWKRQSDIQIPTAGSAIIPSPAFPISITLSFMGTKKLGAFWLLLPHFLISSHKSLFQCWSTLSIPKATKLILIFVITGLNAVLWQDSFVTWILPTYSSPLILLKHSFWLSHLLLFSHKVVSYSLWLHGLQQASLPCLSLSFRVCSNSCPLSRWCSPTISSSATSFSSCPQSFPASRSFPVSWLFSSGGQSIGVSASASALPVNIQGWFPLGLTGLISLQSKGLSRDFSSTTVQKYQFFRAQPSLWSNSLICTWLLEKPLLLLYELLSTKWCHCFLIHLVDHGFPSKE